MFEIRENSFYMDNKPFSIYSGAMHYFRILPGYWEDRLRKLKAAGFNTVETYVPWNLHEPSPGIFDFSGTLDIEKYLETANSLGLYAIVRPGPYICAEWDMGGLPPWLLKDKNMQVRCMYPGYISAVDRFYNELMERLKPHMQSNGGNIIAMQIENEYGSYGNDKKYLLHLKKLMEDNGAGCALFTSDGNNPNMISGGSLPDVYKVLNFGSGSRTAFQALEGFEHSGPNMCGEFWCGWFDHWRDIHHTRKSDEIVNEIKGFLENDSSFNVYMFHGGTNFGFTAGANHSPDRSYEPTVTSYDYCALLNEWGDYTPAYHEVRKLLHEKQGLTECQLPDSPKLQNIGTVSLDEYASLLDNLDVLGKHYTNVVPESMEYFGQNFGLIYYETTAEGKYAESPLFVRDVHDFAYVYVDNELNLRIDRTLYTLPDAEKPVVTIPAFSGKRKISVLVDNMGRVNYGVNMLDRKGISDICLGIQRLLNYDIYTLPLDNLPNLTFQSEKKKCPAFLRGTFETSSDGDCFVHLNGFTKGYVFVNGFNLGRYWNVGPQKSLYLPGQLLKEQNEIIVLEMEGYSDNKIQISDQHDLG